MQNAELVNNLSVFVMLGICSMEDIKNKRIQLKWLAGFAAEGIWIWCVLTKQPVLQILAAMFPGMLLSLFSYISQGGIGFGDGLLVMVIGVFLGAADTIQVLLYAVFLSALWALFLFTVKKKGKEHEIPFIPFLMAAFIGYIMLEYCFYRK